MIQGSVSVVRRWGTSAREVMKALFDAVNAHKYGEVAVDPGNVAAGAVLDVAAIALPAGTAAIGDLAFVQAPATLEAGLVPIAARIAVADQLTIRLYNPTAGGIDGASKTWTYYIVTAKKLVVE